MEEYLSKYYKLDLLSSVASLMHIISTIFLVDYSKGVELEVKRIVVTYIYVNALKISVHLFVIPYCVFIDDLSILKYKLFDKIRILFYIYFGICFIGFVLTTSYKLDYLLHHLSHIGLLCSYIFGTLVHFCYFPKVNDKFNIVKYSNIVVYYVLSSIFGYILGNYLVILDWYQVYIQFPVCFYLSISLGHFIASVIANIYIHV